MLIISQNLSNYNISIPEDAIFRINLAWVSDLDKLKKILRKHRRHTIFLDLPIGRTKPPNNKYSLEDLIPIIHSHPNIEYFAISNVESPSDLKKYIEVMPQYITIVPKIENSKGIKNIKKITDALSNEKKIIMLDHDDLFSSLVKNNEPVINFKEYVNRLVDFCENNDIILLRTKGVIFGDDEKRVS